MRNQSKALHKSHPRVFVAQISTRYNSRLVRQLEALKPDDPGNISTVLSDPLGELLDAAHPEGLRQHYYYALEVWVHQQLLTSPLRVLAIEQADIIFVPIYLGVAQKLVVHHAHQEAAVLLQGFWDEYRKSDSFQSGKPHWIALADIELMYQAGCGGWGMNSLCRKESSLPAALVISTPEIFLGPNPWQPLDFTRAFTRSVPNTEAVAVPYMGHVHWSRGSLRLHLPFNATVSHLYQHCLLEL